VVELKSSFSTTANFGTVEIAEKKRKIKSKKSRNSEEFPLGKVKVNFDAYRLSEFVEKI
jgi:hypothetical protein